MRILQINKFYHPYVGGVETVARQLAEGGTTHGHEVRVLTCNHQIDLESRVEQVNGIPVWRAASFGFLFNASVSPTFPFLYRKAVEWADVVHFHSPSPVPEFTHLVCGVPASKQVVVTFHADPGTSRFKVLSPFYTPVLRQLLRRADRITATAPQNIARTGLLDAFERKTDVIPLATEFEVDPPTEKERTRHRNNLLEENGEEPIILFVGRLAYYKGLQYLLRAMQLVEAQLIIVGDGELRDDLEAKAREHKVAHQVQFEGYVPDEQLAEYYRAADFFVLPSIASIEAFGIVQLDAMAHGLPVVNTSLTTGVPFVSQHEETGLTVQPEDAGDLADAMNRLVNNREYRRELGRNAARRAEDFTEEKMLDRYDELYTELMDQGSVR
ncbi:rhamnosyl/mannosyltransferase [Salinibacter ruber]|uniref:glycosyltransferase n=1 Tax=Salinibacter ruber TaxID=146919 RepID=UPI00216918A1|nr:glycosyltransferase [Salinibacter ruber]MCS4138420.1 rhamnosyl/mannosyltransferase [Salinibacter ruber]